jgi:beta-mannosidase
MPLVHDQWQLTCLDCAPAALPTTGDWRPANVPGTVQTSPFGLPRAELYRGDRLQEVLPLSSRWWLYRRTLVVPALAPDTTAQLIFHGLDYRYTVYLDGQVAADGEGMFHPVTLTLDAWAGRSVDVQVLLHPAPATREAFLQTTKAQFGRGWDFAPHLPTIGIWDDVELTVVPRLRVAEAWVETRLHNAQRAHVTVHGELSEAVDQGTLTVELCGVRREVPLFATARFAVPVEVLHPRLWWPNGMGPATLHDLVLTLAVPGRATTPRVQRVGLRQVERVPAAGQRPVDLPLQLRVNGEPLFIRGLNWVPPDSAVGEIDAALYERHLPQYAAGHANLLRIWGGGLREKAPFYRRCDELGLLVMQEFPIACGMGEGDAYLRQLRHEAEAILRTLRPHPSVFLFTGGNENYHLWDNLDSADPVLQEAHRLLRQAWKREHLPDAHREWLAGAVRRYDEPAHLLLGGLTATLAPHCLYQNTSAMEGEGEVHGIWTWNPRIGDHRFRGYDSLYDYWLAADQHLYSEASVPAIANRETIREVTGRDDDAMPDPDDPVWRRHHAFAAAWDGLRDNWLDLPSTAAVFGPITSLRELVVLNQYLQAEGGRFMIEELRRQQPRTTGIVWWGVNEPWPGLAGNALIDYHGRPKLGWAYIANAYAPTILTFRYRHGLQPRAVKGDLWLCCNDRAGCTGRYAATVTRHADGAVDRYEGEVRAACGQSLPLCRVLPVALAPGQAATVALTLYGTAGQPLHHNRYHFGALRHQVLADHLRPSPGPSAAAR